MRQPRAVSGPSRDGRVPSGVLKDENHRKIFQNYGTSLYMEVYSWETQSMIGETIRAVVAKLVLLMIIGYYITFWMIIVQMSDGFIW